jgi:hypothetical protein
MNVSVEEIEKECALSRNVRANVPWVSRKVTLSFPMNSTTRCRKMFCSCLKTNDYLYPNEFFVHIDLPAAIEKALAKIA